VKRLAATLIAGGAIWLFLAAGSVFADNGPHIQKGGGLTADTCASCHRAHTAGSPLLTVQPQPAICYQCHGSAGAGSTTNVRDGRAYSDAVTATGALRGGGIEYALLDSGSPVRYAFGPSNGLVGALSFANAEPTTSHHSIDFSDQEIWGNGAISASPNAGLQTELRCGSCHNPHGNQTYRILRPTPVDSGASGTAAVTISDIRQWDPVTNVGTLPAGASYTYTTTNYWRPQDPNWFGADYVLQGDTVNATTNRVTLGQDSKDFLGATSKWCATCHTRYMANSGAYDVDSGDAIFKYRHPVWGTVGSTGSTDPNNNASSSAPACLQCHVSHGTNASMGSASSAVTLPGTSTVPAEKSRLLRVDNRGVCQLCHYK
jgi:predicted CXXCH cytochrome family protein